MNTLTQPTNFLNNQLSTSLETSLSFLNAPFVYQFSYSEYGKLFDNMEQWMRKFTLDQFVKVIHQADLNFRNSKDRIKRYYVKQTRQRTIITILGPITYTRTEYIDRNTNETFIPIDRKLCLKSRQRYDSCVITKVKELYADHNSMIKVGKILGDMIYGVFSLDKKRKYNVISRQTIFNCLHQVKKVSTLPITREDTPEVLYVMADEKWVPIQGECTTDKPHVKEMIKVAVCFEGRERQCTKKGETTARYRLVNKYTYASCASDNVPFWPTFVDKLANRYDLNKVKRIYVLGDGAAWIKSAVPEMTMPGMIAKYALDKFHASQAVIRMTNDKLYQEILTYYLYSNMRKDFDYIAAIARKELKTEATIKRHDDNLEYLHKNWDAFQVMIKEVHIGCAMEQAISHIIASTFTSVPKAYSRNNLPVYLDSRIHLINNEDLISIYLEALQKQKNKEDTINLKNDYDSSFFDEQIKGETYSINLKDRQNNKTVYLF